ncbi:hypothetical protein C4J81_08445 [Deltaproteobacteria bacterium Smac51]|nr:hypothetical protein C4J81_08445 [Deltaproteobacteria bacterium Smac51]
MVALGGRGGKGNLSSNLLYKDGEVVGRRSAASAVVLSFLSWPEPDCPASLKPLMVLTATGFWLAALVLATEFTHPFEGLPLFPIGVAVLLAGFVGGSAIAVFTTLLYLLCLGLGVVTIQLPEKIHDLVITGYRHKDIIMIVVFSWLYGVPHWRRRFSWLFTLVWGLAVVFAPLIFMMVNIYFFYGHLPDEVEAHLLERNFLLTWGITVITAAVIAKLLYTIKDFLRRTLA